MIILLCISFSFGYIEDKFSSIIPFASLIAIMAIGIALQKKRDIVAHRLSVKFNKLWVVAEIVLFVLVGATLDIKYAVSAGVLSIILILGVLVFRMLGVCLCLLKTKLTLKRKNVLHDCLYPKSNCTGSYRRCPPAMGLSCGNIVLTVAVVAILITAPLGALVHRYCL